LVDFLHEFLNVLVVVADVVVHVVGVVHNACALPVPCSHRFMFLGVVLGVVSCALLGGSKTVLEANMASTWVDLGAMLEQFWSIFGCCFALFI
jgi:hypothetical protein